MPSSGHFPPRLALLARFLHSALEATPAAPTRFFRPAQPAATDEALTDRPRDQLEPLAMTLPPAADERSAGRPSTGGFDLLGLGLDAASGGRNQSDCGLSIFALGFPGDVA